MRVGRIFILCAGVITLAVPLVVSCFSDPRDGDPVNVVNQCTESALSTDPKSPQSTLRAYFDASNSLLQKATAVEAALRDACNALNQDLGLPKGNDSTSACFPISSRLSGVTKSEPPSPPGALAVNHFVQIFLPNTCTPAVGSLEKCLTTCAGTCDTSKCEPGKVAGTCTGTCVGSCTESGNAVPCNGRCVGETGVDAGECYGECVGTCAAPAWAGACTATCPAGFTGFCAGTCTGLCDGSPIGDAGAPPMDAGDGGDAGDDAEAGPPPPPPPPPGSLPPPTGADGNCKGICVGLCSSGANGNCNAQCKTFADAGPPFGTFQAGFCGGGQVPAGCTGKCRAGNATGNGSTDVCSGACTQYNRPQCTGICRTVDGGGCTGTLSNPFCEGNESCGQNVECDHACKATAALAATCPEPTGSQIILATDQALYGAFVKHQGALGKALNDLAQLRLANSFIGDRAGGDFEALGLTGDLARACVQAGQANVANAQKLITTALAANPITATGTTK
jgi:hypothetical protein